LADVLKGRFPDYIALSNPQPLSVNEIQELLSFDEALITVDLNRESYIWVITKDRADWKQLSVSSDEVAKAVTSPPKMHSAILRQVCEIR
jgi:hypothetical protein